MVLYLSASGFSSIGCRIYTHKPEHSENLTLLQSEPKPNLDRFRPFSRHRYCKLAPWNTFFPLGETMRSHRAVDVSKGVARSVRPGATDTLFSMKPAKPLALAPEEPLASEVQALLNSATNLIECATGGHGRCANSVCGCRCHRSRTRTGAKRRMST